MGEVTVGGLSPQKYIESRLRFRAMNKVEKGCVYHDGKEKFCKMTTQKQCAGCRFYSPNIAVKFQYIAEWMEEANRKIEKYERMLHEAGVL